MNPSHKSKSVVYTTEHKRTENRTINKWEKASASPMRTSTI